LGFPLAAVALLLLLEKFPPQPPQRYLLKSQCKKKQAEKNVGLLEKPLTTCVKTLRQPGRIAMKASLN
jgi:hypothetical protein